MPGFSVSYLHYQMFRVVSLTLVGLLILAIFTMSDSSLATGTLSLDPPLDKLVHAAVYGSIASLLRFSGALQRVPLLWLIVVGLGVLDEWQQMTISGRQASALDLLADIAGISVGLWLVGWLCQRILVVPPAKH